MTGEYSTATVAVMFVSNAGSVRWFLDRYRTVMTLPRALWICSPIHGRADFNRASLQAMLAGHGLRPLEEVALDASWTALRVGRFVPGRPPPR
jgi:hypothetical protein